MNYKKRYITKLLIESINVFPVVVLSGARQTGKSTLIQNEEPFSSWQYITLDDLDVLRVALRNPEELLSLSDNLVIDEIQKAPTLMSAIKKAVDKNRKRRFLLSGSARILLMKKVSESLAGRAIYLDLLPFTLGEILEIPFSNWLEQFLNTGEINLKEKLSHILNSFKNSTLKKLIFKGLLPPLIEIEEENKVCVWWQGYIKTYLERDLRDISEISNLPDFKKILELLALRNASILKQSEIARDAMISNATCGRYINTIEETSLISRIRPYSKNIAKRLIKAPKIIFLDTGMCSNLAGYRSSDEIEETYLGRLLESFVYLHLKILADYNNGEIMYLRTLGGKEKEIDFIVKKGKNLVAIEVKHSKTISYKDIENILFFKNEEKDFFGGIIVYTGDEILKLADKIYAIPWFLL